MRTVILEFATKAFWLVSHKRFGVRMRLEFEARKAEAPNNTLGVTRWDRQNNI
jgi:hypothetical protein